METMLLENIKQPSFTPIISQELSNRITNAVVRFVTLVSKINGVKKIAYKSKGQIITIWTYVDNSDKHLLFEIYNIEQQLIEQHQDITFDFTVIFSSKDPVPTGFYKFPL
jgi:hypothetical protein